MTRRGVDIGLQHLIQAVIQPGDASGKVSECLGLPVVTQGEMLDEVAANLREAAVLRVDGEGPAQWGWVPCPTPGVTPVGTR